MADSRWDLVVLGGGSAGLIAATTAAGTGARVLLVEGRRLGGDCLWTGCVPSKALLAAAARGLGFEEARREVDRARTAIAPVDSAPALERRGVRVRTGTARFTSPERLEVDGEPVAFRRAVVATGSRPRVPDVPGLADAAPLTTETVWDLEALPGRLAVLGGGPAGCELAQAFARLGARVVLVHRGARLLPAEDPAASRLVAAALEADGVDVRRAEPERVEARASGVLLHLAGGGAVEVDRVLAASGRIAAPGPGLAAAGIDVDAGGWIRTDPFLRTTNRRVWAAGDATTGPKHTHDAGVDGSDAALNAVLGLRRRRRPAVPVRVTFTSPEVAAVGVQPHRADPGRHRVRAWSHAHADRAVAEGRTEGFTRIVVDRRGRVRGGLVVGPRAGESLGELALAVRTGRTTGDIAGTVHPYPTYSDAVWNAAIADVQDRLRHGAGAVAATALLAIRRARA